jgi:hypothetical protein
MPASSSATATGMPAQPLHPPQARPLVIELDHALVVRLRPKAARRDVPVVRLIHDLLDVIAADQLTGAILDDGDLPGA